MDQIEEPTGDVISEEQEQGQAEPIEGQQEEPGQGVTEDHQEKPQDDYFKNKAFEFERKYTRTAEELAEIKEMLKEQKDSRSQQQPQYTEEQLQAALSSDSLTPEQRAFAQGELRKMEQKKLEERDERLIEKIRKENQAQQTRAQAEKEVLSDPRFQEAFVKLPNGQVQWNQESKLAQTIGAYMNDPRLKDQPDAISVAAKLAYADMTATQKDQELTKIRRQNEQLKSQTMVEGGGKRYNPPPKDEYRESLERLKSGDKHAGRLAVKEYLRRRGAKK